MTAYFPGDIPADALVIEPARAGEAIDLTPFTAGTVTLTDPDGETVEEESGGDWFAVTVDEESGNVAGTVTVAWPTTTIFTTPGVYELAVTLTGTGVQERLEALRLICQDPESGWYTLEGARRAWQDAPDGDDIDSDLVLYCLLESARLSIEAYAPTYTGRAPLHYRTFQLMQARNIWNSQNTNPAGELGMDSFAIRPYPLDRMIQQGLRPKRPNPVPA